MSELFEGYEKEYCELSGTITCSINALQSASASAVGGKVSALDKQFRHINEALRSMELELQSLPAATKNRLTTRLQNYQKDHKNLQREFEKAKAVVGRRELLDGAKAAAGGAGAGAGAGDHFGGASSEHRDRMRAVTDRVNSQGDTLRNAARLCGEMEELGNSTKMNLGRQREGIERSINTVRETSTEMSRARRLMTMIHRRSLLHKLIIFGIIGFLILLIILIVYFKWIRSSSPSSSTDDTPTLDSPSISNATDALARRLPSMHSLSTSPSSSSSSTARLRGL
eukprot:NODE_1300_length_977_cov_263.033405_g998_i0.p1 GENE.NODE_1300_length_977_cov_263.033405_g998_i0~~NODE_1300_length_977_cov_263.033405_g998_i0.p1  ORF type:complete len:284 (+),score=71.28 NODE_1300_length_977_cov_263.033405_g998_i0:73-924(+)